MYQNSLLSQVLSYYNEISTSYFKSGNQIHSSHTYRFCVIQEYLLLLLKKSNNDLKTCLKITHDIIHDYQKDLSPAQKDIFNSLLSFTPSYLRVNTSLNSLLDYDFILDNQNEVIEIIDNYIKYIKKNIDLYTSKHFLSLNLRSFKTNFNKTNKFLTNIESDHTLFYEIDNILQEAKLPYKLPIYINTYINLKNHDNRILAFDCFFHFHLMRSKFFTKFYTELLNEEFDNRFSIFHKLQIKNLYYLLCKRYTYDSSRFLFDVDTPKTIGEFLNLSQKDCMYFTHYFIKNLFILEDISLFLTTFLQKYFLKKFDLPDYATNLNNLSFLPYQLYPYNIIKIYKNNLDKPFLILDYSSYVLEYNRALIKIDFKKFNSSDNSILELSKVLKSNKVNIPSEFKQKINVYQPDEYSINIKLNFVILNQGIDFSITDSSGNEKYTIQIEPSTCSAIESLKRNYLGYSNISSFSFNYIAKKIFLKYISYKSKYESLSENPNLNELDISNEYYLISPYIELNKFKSKTFDYFYTKYRNSNFYTKNDIDDFSNYIKKSYFSNKSFYSTSKLPYYNSIKEYQSNLNSITESSIGELEKKLFNKQSYEIARRIEINFHRYISEFLA